EAARPRRRKLRVLAGPAPPCAAVDWLPSRAPPDQRLALLLRIVLAQRMPHELLLHQDAAQTGTPADREPLQLPHVPHGPPRARAVPCALPVDFTAAPNRSFNLSSASRLMAPPAACRPCAPRSPRESCAGCNLRRAGCAPAGG